jgi:hypothetical protein
VQHRDRADLGAEIAVPARNDERLDAQSKLFFDAR